MKEIKVFDKDFECLIHNIVQNDSDNNAMKIAHHLADEHLREAIQDPLNFIAGVAMFLHAHVMAFTAITEREMLKSETREIKQMDKVEDDVNVQ